MTAQRRGPVSCGWTSPVEGAGLTVLAPHARQLARRRCQRTPARPLCRAQREKSRIVSATGRFVAQFLGAGRATDEREVLLSVGDEQRPATLYLPKQPARPAGTWILLHGMAAPGRHHGAVRSMARAFTAAGRQALVPEVPLWTALQVRPSEAEPSIRAALAWIDEDAGLPADRVGVMGFSVAGTWALEAAAGELRDRFRAVAAMAAYGDFRRMPQAMIHGEHAWDGHTYQQRPDPYGRWIMGANLLPQLPAGTYGREASRQAAAEALQQLAVTAARHGAPADAPVYDPLIRQLRRTLPPAVLPTWDLLAPASDQPNPEAASGRALADAFADTALEGCPELDPAGRVADVTARVMLFHGRTDRLVPLTESLRLASLLPARARTQTTISQLVGHRKLTSGQGIRHPILLTKEGRGFVQFVRAMLSAV